MYKGSIHLKVKYSAEIIGQNEIVRCSCFESVSKKPGSIVAVIERD